MWSPFSPFGGAGFTSPHMPSHIFPSEEDRAAAMDDVSYYDDEDEHNDDDSDDDGSPNVGGFPPRVRDWKMSTTASSPLSLSTGHVETYLFNSFRNTMSSGKRSTTIYEEVASLWTKL